VSDWEFKIFTIKSNRSVASPANIPLQEVSKKSEKTFGDRYNQQIQEEQKQIFSLSKNWLTALLKALQENQKESRLRQKEKRLKKEQQLKEQQLRQQKLKEERLRKEQQLKEERQRKQQQRLKEDRSRKERKLQEDRLKKQRLEEELAWLQRIQEQRQKEAQNQIKWDFWGSQSGGSGNDKINVRGYKRQDGTYVRGYQRRKSK
jgi:hypothetical protein